MKTAVAESNIPVPVGVPQRWLGRTGIAVSEIGFGTWGLGGTSYGAVDDVLSRETLRCAYDAGVTFYDTSDVYGNGHSEEVLGAALHDVRDRIVIATKVGLLPHTTFEMPCDFSDAHITASVEGSLRRLKTDYIDLYQLHSPTLEMLQRPGLVTTLQRLKQAGKIRAYGVSVRSPADGMVALRNFDFEAIQVNFNLIDHRAIESGLLDLAREKQIGVVARTPLCFGYLTGKLSGNEVYTNLDHRANWPAAQLKRWAEAPDLFSFLNSGKLRTAAQLALRFCLDHPAISTTIPGMMKPAEVRENLVAASLASLDPAEHDLIRSIYQSHSFYDPSAKTKGPGARA
jgi:aryl-alcohol dehydrogenase-like predicted oxidoreductase